MTGPGSPRFVSLGEALVDVVQGDDGRFDALPGGSPFNVALTLGRLGARVDFAGHCGTDRFGDLLTTTLHDAGVGLERFGRLHAPTSLAMAVLDDEGRADYQFYFAGTAGLQLAGLGAMALPDVLHTGSIASWLPPAADAVQDRMRAARGGGSTLLSYDPNLRAALIDDADAARELVERCLAWAHLVKASDDDVALLHPGRSLDEVAADWCALGADLVVITRGAAGAVAFGPDGPLAEIPGQPITVVDTVGAGDSFAGGLLWALGAAGLGTPDALRGAVTDRHDEVRAVLRTAVAVSAMTCQRAGADPPTAQELAAWRAERSAPRPGDPAARPDGDVPGDMPAAR